MLYRIQIWHHFCFSTHTQNTLWSTGLIAVLLALLLLSLLLDYVIRKETLDIRLLDNARRIVCGINVLNCCLINEMNEHISCYTNFNIFLCIDCVVYMQPLCTYSTGQYSISMELLIKVKKKIVEIAFAVYSDADKRMNLFLCIFFLSFLSFCRWKK